VTIAPPAEDANCWAVWSRRTMDDPYWCVVAADVDRGCGLGRA
jgi:hypothetical protein